MKIKKIYSTKRGSIYKGKVEDFMESQEGNKIRNKVQLLFTSPPFPLNRKKKYGNLNGQEYVDWFSSLAPSFCELLKDDGSIVIELGNAWEKGSPTMSTLALEAMLAFKKEADLNLCQQFVWNNPAKLPTPAQWVNVERIRVKDAFTNIWWLSKSKTPLANNKNVLVEYSKSMRELLKRGKYNSGHRPSEHNIGSDSFLTDNKGAIPSNVLTFANTRSRSKYLEYCNKKKLSPHPARMPEELCEFFIKFLTKPRHLVFDPFGGSNTTGAVAESLKRRWLVVEPLNDYIKTSYGRFEKHSIVTN